MTHPRPRAHPSATTQHFSSTTAERLHRSLQRALEVPPLDEDSRYEGLYVSPVDPTGAVRSLKHVRLKPGHILQGYQYVSGSNGSGPRGSCSLLRSLSKITQRYE